MSWRDRTLVEILLLVARIVAPDHAPEVQKLANAISASRYSAEAQDA